MIVDVNACARYLTKYMSKSEPRSKASSEIFANCVSATSDSPQYFEVHDQNCGRKRRWCSGNSTLAPQSPALYL